MALQNGRPLLETNDIEAVRNIGNGQYFWHQENGLYLAPISNVDPRNAGSGISVQTFVFVRLRYIAAALFLFMMALTMQWWSLPLQRMLSRFLPPCGNKENAGMELYGNPSLPDVEVIFLGNRSAGCWNWSDFDLTACVCTWWASVDRRYKTALAVTFPATLLTFSIFTFHYLLTDHYPALPAIPVNDQFFAGRWFARFSHWLTAYSNIPVLQQVLGMAFLLAAGVTTLRLWGLKTLTPFTTTVVLLLIALHPNNLTTFFYTHWPLLYTVSPFLAACGLLIASKDMSSRPKGLVIRVIIGGLFICLAMATYQASISVAATLAAGYTLLRFAEHRGSMKNLLCRHFIPVWSMTATGLLGSVFYRLSLKIAGIGGAYAIAGGDVLSISDIPGRTIDVTLRSLYALWFTQPEFNRTMKIALLLALIMAIVCLSVVIFRNNPYQKRVIFGKWVLLMALSLGFVMATKTMFFSVSMNGFYLYRYNLAMPFFTAFCFFVIFSTASKQRLGLWRSIVAVAACCIVFSFSRSDLLRQGMLLAGHRHDLAMANRVLERVEALPDIDFSKQYYFVRIGSYSPERRRMLNTLQPYDTAGGGHMDVAEIGAAGWAAEVPLMALGSRIKFKGILDNQSKNLERARTLAKERNAKRWPHPSSVFLDDDMIVVNM